MMLGASLGSEITLQATGPDAEAAVAALTRLVEDKFDEA
jgi:phosphotransferase system HPr-like phosphotransfer protein